MKNTIRESMVKASVQMVINDPQLYDQAKKIADELYKVLAKEKVPIAVGVASLEFLLENASQNILKLAPDMHKGEKAVREKQRGTGGSK